MAELDRRSLVPGPATGVLTVTGPPSGSRAAAAVSGAGETVILVAPGTELVEGGVYRVRGSLGPLDLGRSRVLRDAGHPPPAARAQAVQVGRRGGLWGAVDAAHRYVLGRLGAAPAPSPARALVAGIALGDTRGLPFSERESLRASGLYHVVAVSGQNVALLMRSRSSLSASPG